MSWRVFIELSTGVGRGFQQVTIPIATECPRPAPEWLRPVVAMRRPAAGPGVTFRVNDDAPAQRAGTSEDRVRHRASAAR
jgi:hypothetical protein